MREKRFVVALLLSLGLASQVTHAQLARLLFLQPSGATCAFAGGNQSAADVMALAASMTCSSASTPTAGGTLTINGQSLGSYDYVVKQGNQTVSSFTNSDWFTTTADSRAAFVVVHGDLTINSGQTFIPSNRKLFVVVYVTGNLTVSGQLSMSSRGANHSASGSNITAAAIRWATGTYGGVVNPNTPASGAAGHAASVFESSGGTGTAGTSGATGGGGSGGASLCNSGAGAAGSAFSGGPGGGAGWGCGSSFPTAGATAGAAGGNASYGNGFQPAGSGAGNPAGSAGGDTGSNAGANGTGGVLAVFVLGTYSGSGSVVAAGAHGGDEAGVNGVGGGASGGGSVFVLYHTDSSGPTPTAVGGVGGTGVGGYNGGDGGAGYAAKLAGL